MSEYMKMADDLAKQNLITNGGGPFGAVVVKDGKVVGKGNNCVLKNNDPTAHAEMMAIKDACQNLNTYDLTDCTLYTSCYPCPMCLSATIWANIKVVYYGNTKEDAANIGFRDDYIYDYLKLLSDKNSEANKILETFPKDRELTIKTFEEFANKTDKTIY